MKKSSQMNVIAHSPTRNEVIERIRQLIADTKDRQITLKCVYRFSTLTRDQRFFMLTSDDLIKQNEEVLKKLGG